jgi:formamidopyrimidine-DNA glycosylase
MAAKALKKLRAAPETLACDALLDQTIFAVDNIIKSEVLFHIRVHRLPPAKLRAVRNATPDRPDGSCEKPMLRPFVAI